MFVSRTIIDDATATLIERWPRCFAPWNRRRVPIKIGIHRDILAAGVIDADIVGAVLAAYVRSRSYLSNSVEGAARLDLDGQPAGVVTEGEARGASVALARMLVRQRRKRLEREAAAKPTVTAEAPRAPGKRPVLTLKRRAA